MRVTKRMKIKISMLLGVLLCANGVSADDSKTFHNGMSLQGFTGILNTPSAHVTGEGDFYALYSNQRESKWRNRVPYQDNYFFNVGVFNFAEIGATVFDAPRVNRDLSASVKFTTEPFFKKYPYMPVVALGMQDISGGASFLKTKYAVVSEDIWRLRLSAGYGTGPDRMDGFFAGGEFKAHDWLYLLADYDTRESNAGVRAVLPHFWKIPVSFTATAKTSLDYKPGNFDIAVGFSLPLDFKPKNPVLAPVSAPPVNNDVHAGGRAVAPLQVEPPVQHATSPEIADMPLDDALVVLRDRLVKAGFMNVRVGVRADKSVVIEYENALFNHNEMDALGVVFGAATEYVTSEKYETLKVVIKKKGLQMMQLGVRFAALREFMEQGRSLDAFTSDVVISLNVDGQQETKFVAGDDNSSFLSTSLVLWPGLRTLVGVAENGGDTFEYRLSLKPDLYVNLWKGSMLNARWDIPMSWSDKMDDGKMDTIMERLMLFQGIRLMPGIMANLGGGMILHNQYGVMNELVWLPGDGTHRVRLAQTNARNNDTHKSMESYLASYRYYFSPLDLSLEGYVGKFMSQDRGFSLELKRFFGDTTFSVYYKNSTTTDRKHWQAGGIQFAFPLSFEKDMKHIAKMQLRGTDEWTYAQETTFKNSNSLESKKRGELNYIPDVPLAVAPLLTGSLHNQYLNRDRLNESYIKSHLERLRSAWLKYRSLVQ